LRNRRFTAAESRLCEFLVNEVPRYRLPRDIRGARILKRYAVALGAAIVGCGTIEWERRCFGCGGPLFPLYAGLIVTLRTAGIGPGWLMAALGSLAAAWFLPPEQSFAVSADQAGHFLGAILAFAAFTAFWPSAGRGGWDHLWSWIYLRAIASMRRQASASSGKVRPSGPSASMIRS